VLKVKVMKKLVLIFAVAFGMSFNSFGTDPIANKIEKCCPVVVSSAEVEFSYDEAEYAKYFQPASFSAETNSINFESYQDIKYVQIFNAAGEMEYQLPIMSSKVRISKKMFAKGDYKISFLLSNKNEALYTYVTIN
jgi:hypothetical protein